MALVFRDIPGFPGYRVGNDGSVWSRWKRGSASAIGDTWRKMKPSVRANRRSHVGLCRDGKRLVRQVSRLVLESFVGPRPKGKECAHCDGDPSNNNLDNLRWTTHKDNMADQILHGTICRGSSHGCAKLTDEQVLEIRRLRKRGIKYKKIMSLFGISESTASRISRCKRWKHL